MTQITPGCYGSGNLSFMTYNPFVYTRHARKGGGYVCVIAPQAKRPITYRRVKMGWLFEASTREELLSRFTEAKRAIVARYGIEITDLSI